MHPTAPIGHRWRLARRPLPGLGTATSSVSQPLAHGVDPLFFALPSPVCSMCPTIACPPLWTVDMLDGHLLLAL
jgi:hypothetical protein